MVDYEEARGLGLVSTRRMRREDAEAVLGLLWERRGAEARSHGERAQREYLPAFAAMTAEPVVWEEALALREGRACLVDRARDDERVGRIESARIERDRRRAARDGRRLAARTTAETRRACEAAEQARHQARPRINTPVVAKDPEPPGGWRTTIERRDAGMLDTAVREALGILAEQRPDLLDVSGVGDGRHVTVTYFYAPKPESGEAERIGWSCYVGAGVVVFGDAWGERILVGREKQREATRTLGVGRVERSVVWARVGDARLGVGAWGIASRDDHGAPAAAIEAWKRAEARKAAAAVVRRERVLPPCVMEAHEACYGQAEDREWRRTVDVECACACHGAEALEQAS
jgi:hypothetical protein